MLLFGWGIFVPVCRSDTSAVRSLLPRQRFASAANFSTYYGSGKIQELGEFDVAIVHPPQFSPADVRKLRDEGTVVVGYLTIGQDKQLQVGDCSGPGGKAAWYFDGDRDGQPDQDGVWKSWYADVNNAQWRASRVAEARRLTAVVGCDGVFLDVISVSEMYPQCRPGMVKMIHELRAALPEAIIVMNQGFDVVAEVAALVDGVMIESLTATYNFAAKTYELNSPAALDFHLRRAQNILAPQAQKHGLRILVLDYAESQDGQSVQFAANRAASLGCLFSVSPILLDDVYQNIPVGYSDPRWLKRQCTPESLSWKLSESQNGFPSGTVLKPSGCFAGYTVEPLVNPPQNRSELTWDKAAWASSEDGDPVWIEVNLPASRTNGSLAIDWHGSAGISRKFTVQVRLDASTPWREVAAIADNRLQQTRHTLPETPYRHIRVYQGPQGGSAARPNLMWIARLALDGGSNSNNLGSR